MKRLNNIKKILIELCPVLILLGVALLCTIFILCGTKSENGSITLDGQDAKIEEYTQKYIEDANDALYRIMNQDAPTDQETIDANSGEANGQGFYTTIDDILGRREPDGNTDNGLGWQCSKYTAYLATGKREYSSTHTDYGPVNGKAVAEWLVKNYGFKYIDQPVQGAIGSGGFNTTYGHTAMYLYGTGAHTAMVNDANYVPLTVATHNMNIDGWVWVVPGSYNPTPEPTPTPTPTPEPAPVASCKTIQVKKGDTMGKIMKNCTGRVVWGAAMSNYANSWISSKTGRSVYYGWTHGSGYGLLAGDTITYVGN
jgi:hypothetical protein